MTAAPANNCKTLAVGAKLRDQRRQPAQESGGRVPQRHVDAGDGQALVETIYCRPRSRPKAARSAGLCAYFKS